MVNKEELYKFEEEIVELFNDGQIRSPVHLSGSIEGELEDFLINYFKNNVKPNDWIFSTYRSHYHSLLKGVPKDRLKNWVLDNKSIHFMDSEYKIFTSAIVGGTLSIAIGVAMAIKKSRKEDKVHVFIGDMTASTGVFKDCLHYAEYNELPIMFIIEDNGLSTDTVTKEAWGTNKPFTWEVYSHPNIKSIKYKRKYVHYGTGKFVSKLWEGINKEDARAKGF